jgi:hypothetical protein
VAAQRKPCVLMLYFILTFWVFIVAGYVFSLPFSYSLRADKLSNSVIKTVKRFNPNESQQQKFHHHLFLQATFNM